MLAQKFPGLTPEYFDNLSYAQRTSLLAVLEAQHKADQIWAERNKRKSERMRRRRRR